MKQKISSATTASRAVIAAYAKQILRPFEIVAIILFFALLVLSIYLIISVSAWWWILLILVLAYGIVVSLLWLIIHTIIGRLRPPQTAIQREAVDNFIEHSKNIADIMGITRLGLLIRLVRDVLTRRPQTLDTAISGSKDLKHSFTELMKLF